jgi:predicted component of type VI protein secretion system
VRPSAGAAAEDAPQIRLRVSRPGADSSGGESYVFRQRRVTIGRDASNDLVLDDPLVSQRHAEMLCDETALLLVDRKSRNFTVLDGETLTPDRPRAVEADGVIRIGDYEITCERLGGASAEPAETEKEQSRTKFARTFVNPYLVDVGALSKVLTSISGHYDDEAPGRRAVALEEALGAAVREPHDAFGVLARWLLAKAEGSS